MYSGAMDDLEASCTAGIVLHTVTAVEHDLRPEYLAAHRHPRIQEHSQASVFCSQLCDWVVRQRSAKLARGKKYGHYHISAGNSCAENIDLPGGCNLETSSWFANRSKDVINVFMVIWFPNNMLDDSESISWQLEMTFFQDPVLKFWCWLFPGWTTKMNTQIVNHWRHVRVYNTTWLPCSKVILWRNKLSSTVRLRYEDWHSFDASGRGCYANRVYCGTSVLINEPWLMFQFGKLVSPYPSQLPGRFWSQSFYHRLDNLFDNEVFVEEMFETLPVGCIHTTQTWLCECSRSLCVMTTFPVETAILTCERGRGVEVICNQAVSFCSCQSSGQTTHWLEVLWEVDYAFASSTNLGSMCRDGERWVVG